MFKEFVLKNGLRIVSVPLPHFYSATLVFYIKAGSRFEAESQKGAAHFLEHLSFRKTRSFGNKLEIARYLDRLGAKANAGTSKELLQYYIKLGNPQGNLTAAFNFLKELVFETQLHQKLFEREKQIIKNEVQREFDNPNFLLFDQLNKLTWPNQRFGEEVTGDLDDIEDLTLEQLVEFRQHCFLPSRAVLGIVGSFNEKQFEQLCQQLNVYTSSDNERTIMPKLQQSFGNLKWIERPQDKQVRFAFYCKGVKLSDPKRYPLILLSIILGGGIGSRLFQAVREKRGLAYRINSFVNCFSDTGVFGVRTEVDESNLVKTTEVILQEVGKIKGERLTSEELTLAKSKIKGNVALGLEVPGKLLGWYAPRFLLNGEVESFEEFCDRIDQVNLVGLQEIVQEIFQAGQLNFAFTAKKDHSDSLRNLLGINGAS